VSNNGRHVRPPRRRYLLGALDPHERLAYEAHLATCRRCRVSLTDISVMRPRYDL